MKGAQTIQADKGSTVLVMFKQSVPDDWGMLLSAFAASYGIGLVTLLGLPYLVGSTIDGLGLSESQAGLAGTVEFLSVLVSSLIIAPFVNRVRRRTVAFVGMLLAISGNLLCVIQDGPLTYNTLIFFRAIAGFGCGLALAVGNATLSNAADPEKMAAHMSVLFVTLMAITMPLFAWATDALGYKGMYGILAVCMLCVSPLLIMLPQSAVEQAASDVHPHGHENLFSAAAFFMLAAMFCFALRDMSGWAFVERIGLDVGYSGSEISMLLSAQGIIGISGPIVASIIGSRFGIKIPLSIGIITSGLVYFFMLLFPTSTVVFTVSALAIGTTYFLTLTYMLALAAELDTKGRIVAASGGFLSAGAAFGPLTGGYIVEQFGYSTTSWFILGMASLTLIFALSSLQSLHISRS
ncbi:MAG: MFS transporter [Desulfobacteraceae bacterium]|nr:MAG: MFS transporter [Desulfobacteraceae bacterium]